MNTHPVCTGKFNHYGATCNADLAEQTKRILMMPANSQIIHSGKGKSTYYVAGMVLGNQKWKVRHDFCCNSFMHQIFTECPLCARSCFRHKKKAMNTRDKNPGLQGTYILVSKILPSHPQNTVTETTPRTEEQVGSTDSKRSIKIITTTGPPE